MGGIPLPKPPPSEAVKLPRLYIENCEPYSEWLVLEYRHCLASWGNLAFTNVTDPKLFKILSSFIQITSFFEEAGRPPDKSGAGKGAGGTAGGATSSEVRRSSLSELREFDPRKTMVLDPAAQKTLRTSDLEDFNALVIGGILGSEGFTGKTGELLTRRLGCGARNLGRMQLSIDSAAVVARLIALGMRLEDIELTSELEILHDDGHSTVLPYGYPVLNGKVIFTPGLKEYLQSH